MNNGVPGYLRDVPSKSGKRFRAIPAPAWWLKALGEALQQLKDGPRQIDQHHVAQLLRPLLGFVPSDSMITRCKTGEVTTLELVTALSDLLRIPRPVYLAETEAEATWMAKQLALSRIDTQALALAPGAEKPDIARHTPTVKPTEHESSRGRAGAHPRQRGHRVARART